MTQEKTKAFAPAAQPSELLDLLRGALAACVARFDADPVLAECAAMEIAKAAIAAASGAELSYAPSGANALDLESIRARAHAEGKAEGLEEAAREVLWQRNDQALAMRIRSLIPAGPENSK